MALVYEVLDVVVEDVCGIVKILFYLECFTRRTFTSRLDDFQITELVLFGKLLIESCLDP